MESAVTRCLDDLEERIDPAVEEQLHAEWRQFASGEFGGEVFTPRRPASRPPGIEWPSPNVNEAISDPSAMVLQQLKLCSDALANGSGALLCVRANYGTSIIPSLFGVEMFWMSDESNTLPTSWPLPGRAAIRALLDRGLPDVRSNLGGRVLEMGQRFVETLAPYPRIRRFVHIYHPDLQGPLDVCELLWGSRLFLDLYDAPDLVRSLLELVTETYIALMRAWEAVAPPEGGYAVHWRLMHRGRIMLRDDSAMNLSPAMYDEFAGPYDQRLLREFGGGAVHFCGKGDHYVERLSRLDSLYAVNLSQPEYNDMETIFAHTVDRGIPVLDLARPAAETALANGRPLRGLVHCW